MKCLNLYFSEIDDFKSHLIFSRPTLDSYFICFANVSLRFVFLRCFSGFFTCCLMIYRLGLGYLYKFRKSLRCESDYIAT
jgi:hypothetical protein